MFVVDCSLSQIYCDRGNDHCLEIIFMIKNSIASRTERHLQGDSNATLVLAYKHPELVERFKRDLGLGTDAAETLFMDVKMYLYLAAATNKRLAPTKQIDKGWHEFLMYTKDYASFCHQFFGRFVHHVPTPVLVPHVVDDLRSTIECARKEFGTLSTNWDLGSTAADCNKCVNVGCGNEPDCAPDVSDSH